MKPPDTDRRERLAAALAAARAGDRHGLDDLVKDLSPLLWHVARAQGLDREDTIDVVQNTWLALVSSVATIRNPSALVSWLITVTRREAWRVAANRRTEQVSELDPFRDLPDTEPSGEDRVLTGEQRAELWAAIGQLSKRCQELLRIVAFVERPDYQAVSAALGMPVGSIGPTRGRCLAKLRALLQADPDSEGRWQP